MSIFLQFFSRGPRPTPAVDAALAAWTTGQRRPLTQPRLSGTARTRIAARLAHGDGPAETGSSLFVPLRRVAVAALAPALALAVALGALTIGRHPATAGPARVQAIKQGDDVVFVIANGQRNHRIYRSDAPAGGQWEALGTTRQEFRDRLRGESNLVFYRID